MTWYIGSCLRNSPRLYVTNANCSPGRSTKGKMVTGCSIASNLNRGTNEYWLKSFYETTSKRRDHCMDFVKQWGFKLCQNQKFVLSNIGEMILQMVLVVATRHGQNNVISLWQNLELWNLSVLGANAW